MAIDAKNLIWIDLEMTGLDTDNDYIIEIATIVTDQRLNILEEGPVIAIYQSDEVIGQMDDWNTSHHGDSGLIKRVRESKDDELSAQEKTLDFLKTLVPKSKSPMCGNSICQDRRFMHRCMPELEQYFHYRNLDVSSLKELAKRWNPSVYNAHKKDPVHLALADIKDSIEELKHYRANFLNTGE